MAVTYMTRSDNGTFETMWTPARKLIVRHLYLVEGLSLRKVAEYFGCSHGAVQNLCNEMGWIRKRRTELEDYADQIREYYVDDEFSPSQIADLTGFDVHQIEYFAKREGYYRTHAEATSLRVETGGYKKSGIMKSKSAMEKALSRDCSSYEKYAYAVYKLTSIVAYQFSHAMNNLDLRSYDFHLDHRYSIRAGFFKSDFETPRRKPMPLRFMCHPANLRILSALDNINKGADCDFSFQELKRRIQKFENKHGVVFNV